MSDDLKRFCSGVVALRLARKAMDAALELAENEADQRGDNDKLYTPTAKSVCRKLRTAISKADAVLDA